MDDGDDQFYCDVYRSPRKEGLYLYVRRGSDLNELPEALLATFGEPELALTFELHAERRMAREDPKQVMANLEEHSYHLQLPPVEKYQG